MPIQPNSKLEYKEGKRRVTVWFHNLATEGEYAGLIYFNVNIKQASRSFTGGNAYVHPETHQVTLRHDSGMQEYIDKAIATTQ